MVEAFLVLASIDAKFGVWISFVFLMFVVEFYEKSLETVSSILFEMKQEIFSNGKISLLSTETSLQTKLSKMVFIM